MTESSTAIVWFRRDLRLHDNPALSHALSHHQTVIPLYIHAPQEEQPWSAGSASRWWLHQSLAALAARLDHQRSRLILRRGSSLETLNELIATSNASAVYWNRLYEPMIIARDKAVKSALREQSITAQSFNACLLWEPWAHSTAAGTPYKMFTPFWRSCTRQSPPQPQASPGFRAAPASGIRSAALSELGLLPETPWYETLAGYWQPGEAGGLARLETFTDQLLPDYHRSRDRPALDGVSRLSPYLHFGEVSSRRVWWQIQQCYDGDALDQPAASAYLRQLVWREFAHYVLYHWPHTQTQSLQPRFEHYPWQHDTEDVLLTAWQQGRTGIPLIDAGLRELWHSGWMHNRVRMVVASFLTKNLGLHWLHGARWFWDTLVDADLANNTMGWQWTAGCGTDAAPYFRIFNPVRQGEQYDPEGHYVRRWLPVLERVPSRRVHQPWQLSRDEQQHLGFIPGQSYPLPVVDLASSRKRALAGYEQIKSL